MKEYIDKEIAIKALWNALYEYEDKTEKQFLDNLELDICSWFEHRIFVQNMSDIDRQTVLKIQPADVRKNEHGEWINGYCNQCGEHAPYWPMATTYYKSDYCPHCGADMRKEVKG